MDLAANPCVVEVVLLGIAGGVDDLRSGDLSGGGQERRPRDSRSRHRTTEGVPETVPGLRLRLPAGRGGGSRGLVHPVLLCVRLRDQVPQFPKEIEPPQNLPMVRSHWKLK